MFDFLQEDFEIKYSPALFNVGAEAVYLINSILFAD